MQLSRWTSIPVLVLYLCLWPLGAASQQGQDSGEEIGFRYFDARQLGSRQSVTQTDLKGMLGALQTNLRARSLLAVPKGENNDSARSVVPPKPVAAKASHPKGEFYGGFSYASLRLPGLTSRKHSIGWSTGVTGNLTKYFGITADFAGLYKPKCAENDVECFVELLRATEITNYSSYQFLAGPQFRAPGKRFNGFVHALFGGVRSKASLLSVATGVKTEFTSGPNFAMAYGGGLDWNLSPEIGVRVFQFDYIPSRNNNTWRHDFRIQGGVVFRFGFKK